MARVFTLEEAKSLMPAVRSMTGPVFLLAASLAEELSEVEEQDDSARAEALRDRLQILVESWADGIRDMGADVKGLWLVDFDSGDGYWCWAYPEENIEHWHSYDGGFGSRVPVYMRPVHQT